jgi:hypothetical protein
MICVGLPREKAIARWEDVVTGLRVKHGVWVSLPALLHRVGLNSKPTDESARINKQLVCKPCVHCLLQQIATWHYSVLFYFVCVCIFLKKKKKKNSY